MIVDVSTTKALTTLTLNPQNALSQVIHGANNEALARLECVDDTWVCKAETGYVLVQKGIGYPSLEVDPHSGLLAHVESLDSEILAHISITSSNDQFTRLGIVGLTCDTDVEIGESDLCAIKYVHAGLEEKDSLSDTKSASVKDTSSKETSNKTSTSSDGLTRVVHGVATSCILHYERGVFSISDLGMLQGVFVNNIRLVKGKKTRLNYGDTVACGFLRVVMGYRHFVLYSTSNRARFEAGPWAVEFQEPPALLKGNRTKEEAAFFPQPRFVHTRQSQTLTIDAPPAPQKPDETPIAMKIGPSLVMSFGALFSGAFMFSTMLSSTGNPLRAMPMLVMALSMATGAVVWPIVSRRMQNKKIATSEQEREDGYTLYLDAARARIETFGIEQLEALENNYEEIDCVLERLSRHDTNLMNHISTHDDFMCVRMGKGTIALDATINWPQERFQIEVDDLTKKVSELSKEPRVIDSAPIALNLVERRLVGVVGTQQHTEDFMRGLITEIACLHSPDEVKICVLASEDTLERWRWAMSLPHAFDDNLITRFCTHTKSQTQELSLILERIASARSEERAPNATSGFVPRYVVVCTDPHLAVSAPFETLSRYTYDVGMSLVVLAPEIALLPKRVSSVITLKEQVEEGISATFRENIDCAPLDFVSDITLDLKSAQNVSLELNRIPLTREKDGQATLPSRLGYLDMFECANVGDLNLSHRWAESSPQTSLSAVIGAGESGSAFTLDLHESMHGPHALIAGTTGSGKSEFIITWILSMCVNFSPDDVAFVLIDYKGGGLAGAFGSKDLYLPHLAGTITNLDGAQVIRSMISIQSELRRRQDLFNKARNVCGGDNVDIARYIELYRSHKVDEPLPHLFIVADEFAELKDQEPEFLDELVSAARIGRSLGVHLILATQKPTGVVNDQIRSNARAKICLKVAESSDSKEMIGRSDAAEISNPGRFCMLVGYNDLFTQGQAAWAGGSYVEREVYEPPKDDAVCVISATGKTLSSFTMPKQSVVTDKSELVSVLQEIKAHACAQNLSTRPLWLDPLPTHLSLADLKQKYNHELKNRSSFDLCPLIGEIDDPAHQLKHPLFLPLSKEGNAVIYGSAGSGKSACISAMVADLIETYSADELNIYLVDLAAETLSAFKDAPQVGGVLGADSEEQIENLFKIICREVADRRALFAGGANGLKEAHDRLGLNLAHIVVVINNIAALIELFPKLEEMLLRLLREANRFGIHFVIAANSSNDVRYRMTALIKRVMCLELADENQYVSVFGTMRGVPYPKGLGRGIVKTEQGSLVFQAAFPEKEGEDYYECAQALSILAKEKHAKATSSSESASANEIPVVPAVLTLDNVLNYPGEQGISVGVNLSDLTRFNLNLNTAFTLIAAQRVSLFASSLEAIIQACSQVSDTSKKRSKKDTSAESTRTLEVLDYSGVIESDTYKVDLAQLCSDLESQSAPRIVVIPDIGQIITHVPVGSEAASWGSSLLLLQKYLQNPEKKAPNTHFVIGVNSSSLATLQLQEWATKILMVRSYYWIGGGLSSQYVLAYSATTSQMQTDGEEGSGLRVSRSSTQKIKFVVVVGTDSE